jgi:hypothetical protein
MLDWDKTETDQVVVSPARITIADAAMILRMNSLAQGVRPQIGIAYVREAMRGPFQAM